MSVTLELPLALHILEAVITENQYIASDKATDADIAVANALGAAPAAEYTNLNKWFSEVKTSEAAPAEDEEDIDLFGSDEEEDAEAERIKAQRVAEYNARKANKPKTIAKTTITLEIKPWDDETDMDALTAAVRAIAMDGLLWGGSQFVPIGYGIRKLQINCVVEDDKVLLDDLTEQITDLEDFVQSVDIAAMQKI
ncbi:hypothetical protein BY458DRAFT_485441 [Sporodiniella umbellata]|nr:hypothetical protein BY458DRAFT_485441 [Sporodiniella umbellata]